MVKNIIPIIFLVFFFHGGYTHAASFYTSPRTGNFTTQNNFSLGVYLSSVDQSTNAISGTISFPEDQLQVLSISKSNSIVNLWVKEPNFSNSAGTISFEGVILNPGYQGANGRIMTISFKPKTEGVAKVVFVQGQALANDGMGTDILVNKQGGEYIVTLAPEIINLPKQPVISTPPVEVPVAIEALISPRIIYLSKQVNSGNPLVLYGTTYPNSKVIITLSYQNGEEKNVIQSDQDGKFSYVHNKLLDDGLYQVSAKVIDEKGNESEETSKEIIHVQPPKVEVVTKKVIDYLTLAIISVSLMLLLGIVIIRLLRYFMQLRRSVYKETKYADTTINNIFKKIDQYTQHIEFLEREAKDRGMTTEERILFRKLKQQIELSREEIHKELASIKNIVK